MIYRTPCAVTIFEYKGALYGCRALRPNEVCYFEGAWFVLLIREELWSLALDPAGRFVHLSSSVFEHRP